MTWEYIKRSLTGAWRLFRNRPDAMDYFDLSRAGLVRSFLPVILFWLLTLAWSQLGAPPDLATPQPVMASSVVGLFLSYCALSASAALAAKWSGAELRLVPLLVAYNWSWPISIGLLLAALGPLLLATELIEVVGVPALVIVLIAPALILLFGAFFLMIRYLLRVVRHSLGISTGHAWLVLGLTLAATFALDFLVSRPVF